MIFFNLVQILATSKLQTLLGSKKKKSWKWNTAHTEEMKNAYQILVGKYEL